MSPKILVVDDSSLARRTTRNHLEAMGYEVEEAMDGYQALERFYYNPHLLVILDLVMPGMDGSAVLKQLLALDNSARVIIATADVQHLTAAAVRASGAKAILNKPIKCVQLRAAIDSALNGNSEWDFRAK